MGSETAQLLQQPDPKCLARWCPSRIGQKNFEELVEIAFVEDDIAIHVTLADFQGRVDGHSPLGLSCPETHMNGRARPVTKLDAAPIGKGYCQISCAHELPGNMGQEAPHDQKPQNDRN